MKGLKYNNYIGVYVNGEIRLVTKFDNKNRMCYWNVDEKPLEIGIMTAKDIVLALGINGFEAFVITTLNKYKKQPFLRANNE